MRWFSTTPTPTPREVHAPIDRCMKWQNQLNDNWSRNRAALLEEGWLLSFWNLWSSGPYRDLTRSAADKAGKSGGPVRCSRSPASFQYTQLPRWSKSGLSCPPSNSTHPRSARKIQALAPCSVHVCLLCLNFNATCRQGPLLVLFFFFLASVGGKQSGCWIGVANRRQTPWPTHLLSTKQYSTGKSMWDSPSHVKILYQICAIGFPFVLLTHLILCYQHQSLLQSSLAGDLLSLKNVEIFSNLEC